MTNDSEEKQPPRPSQAEKPAESPVTPSGSAAGPSGAASSGAGGTPPGEPPKPAAPSPPAVPAKPAAAAPPKPAAPAAPAKPAGPPPPPKEAPPKPVPLDNELVKRYKSRFGGAIVETWLDRKQAILVVAAERLPDVARYSRDEERFDLLVDLTAADWPKREK